MAFRTKLGRIHFAWCVCGGGTAARRTWKKKKSAADFGQMSHILLLLSSYIENARWIDLPVFGVLFDLYNNVTIRRMAYGEFLFGKKSDSKNEHLCQRFTCEFISFAQRQTQCIHYEWHYCSRVFLLMTYNTLYTSSKNRYYKQAI